MILSCPSCGTRYLVDPAVLGHAGRTVRCAKCANTWRQEPPVDMPKRIDVLPPLRGPGPIPPGSNLPVLFERRRRADRIGWFALALAVAVLVVGALAAREPIVNAWPASVRLYRAIGFETAESATAGLHIRNVEREVTEESGVRIMVITGEIENLTGDTMKVPAIRVGLIDNNEQELHHWTFAAERDELEPGGVTAFTTRLTGPPAAAILSLRFASGGHG
jgi:predicted Zn finger-like uncharacterized protein